MAEKILATLAMPYLLIPHQDDGAKKTVTHMCSSSIGVTLFVNHEVSHDDLLRWADRAMYVAKQRGRNQICFDDTEC